METCVRHLICIDGVCFDNSVDAGKFLLHLASRRQKVTISRRIDTSACRPS